MTIRRFCDRCDEEIPDTGAMTDVFIDKVGMVTHAEVLVLCHIDDSTQEPIQQSKDLCAPCYIRFKEWFGD